MTETKLRSLAKALSWRIVASLVTGTLVFIFTHQGVLAVSIGLLDSAVKIMAYFLHERLWASLRFGRRVHQLEDIQISGKITEEDKNTIRQKLRELGYIDE